MKTKILPLFSLSLGKLNYEDKQLSWTGNSSQSVDEIIESLYTPIDDEMTFYEKQDESLEKILLLPFGNCLEVKNYSDVLYMGSTSALKAVYIYFC